MKLPPETKAAHRVFFSQLATKFGVEHPDQWYAIPQRLLKDKETKNVLWSYYKGDLVVALRSIFPEYPWKIWKFDKIQSLIENTGKKRSLRKYWSNRAVQKEYLDWFKEEHGVKNERDLYKLRASDFIQKGGATLINHYYRGSVFKLFSSLYKNSNSSFNLLAWRFNRIPNYFWTQQSNVIRFLNFVQEYYSIYEHDNSREINEWMKLSNSDFSRAGGSTLLSTYGGIFPILLKFKPQLFMDADDSFPSVLIDKTKEAKNPPKTQQILNSYVDQILSSKS